MFRLSIWPSMVSLKLEVLLFLHFLYEDIGLIQIFFLVAFVTDCFFIFILKSKSITELSNFKSIEWKSLFWWKPYIFETLKGGSCSWFLKKDKLESTSVDPVSGNFLRTICHCCKAHPKDKCWLCLVELTLSTKCWKDTLN